jgi:hypothetical protein
VSRYPFTKAEIVAALKQAAEDVGGKGNRELRQVEFDAWSRKRPAPKRGHIYQHPSLGSWPAALKAAGLKVRQVRKTDAEVAASVAAAVSANGGPTSPLGRTDYEQMVGTVKGVTASGSQVARRYGGWQLAAEEEHFTPRRWDICLWDKARAGAVVRDVCEVYGSGRPLSVREFNTVRPAGTPAAAQLAANFDGWYSVLLLAGFTQAEIDEDRWEKAAEANRQRFAKSRRSK